MNIKLTLAAIAAAVALAACGGDGSSATAPGPGPGTPGSGDASTSAACINEALMYNTGSTWTQKMRDVDDAEEFTLRWTVQGPDTFNGNSVIARKMEVLEIASVSGMYYTARDGNFELNYGYEAGPISETFTPARKDILVQKVDEPYTTTFTGSISGTQTWTQTYLGREEITVPAGTFETCAIEIDYGGGDHLRTWVAAHGPYRGLPVYEEELDEGDLTRLEAISIEVTIR